MYQKIHYINSTGVYLSRSTLHNEYFKMWSAMLMLWEIYEFYGQNYCVLSLCLTIQSSYILWVGASLSPAEQGAINSGNKGTLFSFLKQISAALA